MQKHRLIVGSLVLFGIIAGLVSGLLLAIVHDLPQINRLKQYRPPSVTTVYSSDNEIITRFYIEKRFPVKIDQIPRQLIQALITIEDRLFFSHSGINLKAIVRAAVKDIQAGRFKEGASTLTQQLAKTLFLTNEKSIVRKIKELLLAIQIERRYTKNEILELYLNQIYLGSGTYGVEAASREYFGKSVSDLNLDEVALIAGLPKAPSVYTPKKNPDLAKKRRDVVLYQMMATGVIEKQEYESAVASKITLRGHSTERDPAAWFVAYIKSIIKNQFDLKAIYSQGLNIQTTLNLDLQRSADQIVRHQMDALKVRMERNGLKSDQLQCAAVAIDVETGGISCMIGGINFTKSVFNRAVQAKRQPGSAFKPFVFAAALEQGFDQNEILLDGPLSYQLENGKTWQVNNFSRTFSGNMTFRKALALSKNTPAVRLIEKIGPETVAAFAKNAGIRSKLYANLSLALGTSEVTLLELTAGYIPFANAGIKIEPYPIIKITDSQSRLIYRHTAVKHAILTRANAAIMTNMLKAVVQEGTGKRAKRIKKEIAGKTGTTDSYKDALFVGFSPGLALGVWVGNDDSTPLGKYETGAKAALPVWTDIMTYYLDKQDVKYFDIPDGTKVVYMNPENGKINHTGGQN